MKKLLILFLTLILASSAFVYAKSAEGGSEVTVDTSTLDVEEVINCEDVSDMKERVKCRFDHGTVQTSVPEACRVLSDTTWCEDMYAKSQTCYNDKWGVERDQCLRDVVGFSDIHLTSSLSDDREKFYRYFLLLLYDLEYYAEKEFNQGNIDSDTASDLIVAVVDMKHHVINRGDQTQLRVKLNAYKDLWSDRK